MDWKEIDRVADAISVLAHYCSETDSHIEIGMDGDVALQNIPTLKYAKKNGGSLEQTFSLGNLNKLTGFLNDE